MKRYSAMLALAAGLPFMTPVASAQSRLTDAELVSSLQVLDDAKSIDVIALRRKAVDSVAANRAPKESQLAHELDDLSQFAVSVSFRLDSAAIEPSSFRTIGVMADALHHPSLLQYRFLVVGHADAKGSRTYNLELSQKRADAIRNALVTTFGIAPARVLAVGLGEEQLRDPSKPDAALNRRVQLVNIGKFR